VRWVNVAGVPAVPHRREGSSRYLHAKILWFSGKQGELLVAGSANPSVAAFFAPANARNAEAVVADRRSGAGTDIGIDALVGAPPITAADWTAVADRREAKPAPGKTPSRRIWVATPSPQGFRTQEPLSPSIVLQGIGDNSELLGEAVAREDVGTTIEAPEVVRDRARYLEFKSSEEHLLVIVHRTEDIAKNLGGDTRKALRQALGALEEDPSQLDTLLKLTEKVIFDSGDVVRMGSLRPTGAPEPPKEHAAAAASLALDAAGRKAARRRRSIASGDIVVLLDALIRRLGEGLPGAASPPRSDEAEIGADEEDGGELARAAPDFEVLAKACRGKVRRLIRRMEGQFKLAGAPEQARRGVVQLAAVLGVVRALRMVGQRPEWRRRQLELVDRDDERRLFETAVLAVIWGNEGLAPRAIVEADGEWFDELSLVVGLLVWLAWDVEVDAEEASKRGGLQGVEDASWYPVQLLAALGPWFADDENAARVLEESVARTPRFQVDGDRWLLIHHQMTVDFVRVCAEPDAHGEMGRRPNPGDLVILGEQFAPRVRVVQDVVPSNTDSKVVVFDSEKESGQRAFLCSRVASLPWSRDATGTAVSA
jgi:hypothetical protein